jgi:hypothetical protein
MRASSGAASSSASSTSARLRVVDAKFPPVCRRIFSAVLLAQQVHARQVGAAGARQHPERVGRALERSGRGALLRAGLPGHELERAVEQPTRDLVTGAAGLDQEVRRVDAGPKVGRARVRPQREAAVRQALRRHATDRVRDARVRVVLLEEVRLELGRQLPHVDQGKRL